MSSSEKFCLRWNDFETNISVAFRELREEKDFFDVTLACDDSQIQAHKVILSACSPFFRNVLRRNPHQHPLLYLKGVKYKELLSVLNFMYMGEVNVAQEELNSFLSVAEDLRVKGLTQNNANNSETPSSKVSLPKSEPPKNINRPREPPERDPVPPPKRPRPSPVPQVSAPRPSYQEEEDDIQEVVPVKSEPRDTFAPAPSPHLQQPSMSHTVAPVDPQPMYQDQGMQDQGHGTVALDDTYGDESYDYGQYGEGAYDDGSGMIDPNTGMPLAGGVDGNKDEEDAIDKAVVSQMQKNEGGWQCLTCGWATKLRARCWEHVEAKHVETNGYSCPFCDKFCPSKNSLKFHKSKYHRESHY